ncbi:hypothetical protein WJX79_004705 [Trebouxia sp. C0005]
MLISGIGFSALQRATHNPYEHLFTTGSSPKQYMVPSAWGPASAPAPSPFLQPMLQASGGSLSIESANEGTPEPAPSRQQSGLTPGSVSFGPASSQSSRASSPGLAHPYGAPGSAPFIPAASTLGGASASIESASPEDSGAAPPGDGQAELSPIIPYSNSSKGMSGVPIAAPGVSGSSAPSAQSSPLSASSASGPLASTMAYSPSGQHPGGAAPLSAAAFGPAGITAASMNGLSNSGSGDSTGGSSSAGGVSSGSGFGSGSGASSSSGGGSTGSGPGGAPVLSGNGPGDGAGAGAPPGSAAFTEGMAGQSGAPPPETSEALGAGSSSQGAEPLDVEDATSMPALSSAATAATAATAVVSTQLPPQEDPQHDPVLGSGPSLSDAIVTATATPAQMVAVPLSEQQPVTLSSPGVNAAFLEQQADPILVHTNRGSTSWRSNVASPVVPVACQVGFPGTMEVVELNVGGRIFVTTRSTLCKHSNSMLAAMFSGDMQPAQQDHQGRFFIDRNGDHFAIILAYLRNEPLQLLGFGMQRRALEAEARFYQLQDLEQQLSCGVQQIEDTKADLLQRDIAKSTFEEGRMVLFESAKAQIGAVKVTFAHYCEPGDASEALRHLLCALCLELVFAVAKKML